MSLPPVLPLATSRAVSCVVVAIVFPVIAATAVIGRFYSRHVRRISYGADDWLILIALLAVFAQMTITIMSTVYGGVGLHLSDLSPDNLKMFHKLLAGVQFTFGTSLGLAKISICALLLRVFIQPGFRIGVYILITYCICWMLMVIFIGAGLCQPFAYNWNKSIDGSCGNLNAAYISIAALEIVGDVAIILISQRLVWKLAISTLAKLVLSLTFALGFIDVIAAILRIYYLTSLDFAGDYTWEATGTYVWSIIEPSLGVIVACGPALKPVLVRCWNHNPTNASPGLCASSRSTQWAIAQRRPHSDDGDSYIALESVGVLSGDQPRTIREAGIGHTISTAAYDPRNGSLAAQNAGKEGQKYQIWVKKEVSVSIEGPAEDSNKVLSKLESSCWL